MKRAYSLLTIKAADEGSRTITGIATTPTPDLVDDVVEPEGAEFKLPLPLLWQHNHREPIGHVTRAKVTPGGIEITAKLASVAEPGKLKDRLDEAWQSIKTGLVAGLSIGFKGIEIAEIQGTWGVRYLKWAWLELSAVTIPANTDATITAIKAIDQKALAASGKKALPVVRLSLPGASGPTPKKAPVEGKNMPTISEQIATAEAQRASKAARMEAIMTDAGEKGETLDAAQEQEHDGLADEVKSLDKHLERLRLTETLKANGAKPVRSLERDVDTGAGASRSTVQVKQEPKLAPGVAFARVVKCIGLAQGNRSNAAQLAKEIYGERNPIAEVLKAAVAAGTTGNATWAGALVGDEGTVFADFVEFLRPRTILGRFGFDGIPGLRRIPFRTPVIAQTTGGQGYWVGEGKAKPLTKFDFVRQTLEPLKVANIAVLTKETIRDSSPNAEILVRDGLAAALMERMDVDFIDPAKAASAGISPASITNGITPIPSSGNTADDIRADIRALIAAYTAANNPASSLVLIMRTDVAVALSLMMNPLGNPEFPGVTIRGGTLLGFPLIVSDYVPLITGGSYVVAVNAQDVYLADDGGIEVDMSEQASLQMSDTPTQSASPTVVDTTVVSLWQTNSVGFRAERTINWLRRRTEAVQLLSGVNWGN